ncbi:MAG: choice-of-anchor tandem repeat GloVer-containing protein [Candidatus Sulfotelmatobacter sp.]
MWHSLQNHPRGCADHIAYLDGADGEEPSAGLVQGIDGNLYGTTFLGGTESRLCNTNSRGCGTVFKITTGGTLTTLLFFDGGNGGAPSGLIQGTDGNFYGTTQGGGVGSNCENGCGTVFRVSPSGTLTTLHSFNATDGAFP